MDLTLKITAGPEANQEFTCAAPETFLGRSQRCAIRLASPSISFEHALISRNGDEFFIENLSANGTLLNNQKLTAKTRLKAKDQIRLSNDTTLRIEKLPAAPGTGSASLRATLVALLILVLFGSLAFLVWDPFTDKTPYDWPHAYTVLQTTLDTDAAAQMPAQLPRLFREAWRLETAAAGAGGDRTSAKKAWLEIHVALSDFEARTNQQDAANTSTSTLAHLLKNQPTPTPLPPETFLPTLHQFVVQMEHRK